MKVGEAAKNLGHPRGKHGEVVARWLAENKSVYVQLLEYLDFDSKSRILEIGYGPGYGIEMVFQARKCFIDGIDISQQMFLQSWKYLEKLRRNGNIRLLCGDFLTYKLESEQYDCIYFCNVIYFWKDIQRHFEKIHRLLKENGACILFMGDPENLEKGRASRTSKFNKYEIAEIEETMREIGFRKTKVEEFREEKGCFYIIGEK